MDGLLGQETEYNQVATTLEKRMDVIVNESSSVSPLDVNNEEDANKIWEILMKNHYTKEYWALLTGNLLAIARKARADGNWERAI